jgi:hypothetical protein
MKDTPQSDTETYTVTTKGSMERVSNTLLCSKGHGNYTFQVYPWPYFLAWTWSFKTGCTVTCILGQCGGPVEMRSDQFLLLHKGPFSLTLLSDFERRWLPRLRLKKLPRLSDAVSSFLVALNCAVANSSARDLFGIMPFWTSWLFLPKAINYLLIWRQDHSRWDSIDESMWKYSQLTTNNDTS